MKSIKYIVYFWMALALTLLATACSTEESINSDEPQVGCNAPCKVVFRKEIRYVDLMPEPHPSAGQSGPAIWDGQWKLYFWVTGYSCETERYEYFTDNSNIWNNNYHEGDPTCSMDDHNKIWQIQ